MRILRNGLPDMARPVVRFHCKVCDCLFEAERHEYTICTAATARRASGGSTGLASEGCAPAGRACADAQRRDCYTENDYRNGYYHRARCPCCGKDVTGGVLVENYLKARENRWKDSGRT